MIFASTRGQIADFLAPLIEVYTIIIIAWVVASLVFSLGVRVPYSAPLERGPGLPARRAPSRTCASSAASPLRIGPFDLSPIVAIIVLVVGGNVIVGIVRG